MSYDFIAEAFGAVLPFPLYLVGLFLCLHLMHEIEKGGRLNLSKKRFFIIVAPSFLISTLSLGYIFIQGPSEKIDGLFGIEIGSKFTGNNEYTLIKQGNIEREVLSEYYMDYEADDVFPKRSITLKVNPADEIIYSISVKFIYSSEESFEKGYEILDEKLKEKLKNSFLYSADYFDGDATLKITTDEQSLSSVYSVVIDVKSLKLEREFKEKSERIRESNKSISIDKETKRTREFADKLI